MAGYSSYHSTNASGRESDFQRLAQSVISNIQKLSQNVRSMEMMVNQLDTSQDNDSLRADLHKIQHYTNQLAKDTNGYMKQMQALPSPSNPAEQRQWKLQRDRLARDFSGVLNALQSAQRLAAQKEKDSVQKTKQDLGRGSKFAREENIRSGEQLIQLESPVQAKMSLQLEDETNLEMLREREEAIHQLENDIVEVNHIFKDLSIMVHEQGEMIDSIEAVIDNASVHVDEGRQQLAKARDYQTASRRKLCIISIIGIVVLAVVITIIVVSVKH